MTSRIVVLGLGRMGLPIARRLAAAGDVAGFDVDPARRAAAAEQGVRTVPDADAAVARADVVVLVLPGAAVQRAAVRRGGLLDSVPAGALVIELTSGAPDLSDELSEACASRGADLVCAPMAGGPADADAGTLGFFVAGGPGALQRARPLLDVLARPEGIQHVGDVPGQAQLVKLLINAVWFGQAALVTEALLIAAKSGVAPERIDRILNEGAAASAFTRDYLPRLRAGDYLETFGIVEVVEELDSVADRAASLGVPASLLEASRALHVDARREYGDVDGELLVARLLENRAGMRLSDGAIPPAPGERGSTL
jgi:3-hydroxyisobutyrate dehydrogenase-like beta-hydroxyacid dehydrogenase